MSGYAYLAFTGRGAALARELCAAFGGAVTDAREERDFSLRAWTQARFDACAALIFIGAAGIAVRAIAPFAASKAEDPAVLVLDERGRYVIPLLSGHLGGANELARRMAAACGATPVITTATDINGVFAVDCWARRQSLSLRQPERIKAVSARLLAGGAAGVFSAFPIAGAPPEGVRLCAAEEADVLVDVRRRETGALALVPRCLTLGLGCRRGIAEEALEAVLAAFLEQTGVDAGAIAEAATIDRKADEAGLRAFCERHGWPLRCFPAQKLREARGSFTASAFVEETVGVDNVCERSAALASGGALYASKFARDGVTMALAMRAPELDWSWQDE